LPAKCWTYIQLAAIEDSGLQLGGVSFSRYSSALKTLQKLKEEMNICSERVASFQQLVEHLMVSVPSPLENEVVKHVLENAATAERERDELVITLISTYNLMYH